MLEGRELTQLLLNPQVSMAKSLDLHHLLPLLLCWAPGFSCPQAKGNITPISTQDWPKETVSFVSLLVGTLQTLWLGSIGKLTYQS